MYTARVTTWCGPIRGEYCHHVTCSPPITAHLGVDQRDGDPIVVEEAAAPAPELVDLLDDCPEGEVVFDPALLLGAGHDGAGPDQGHPVLGVLDTFLVNTLDDLLLVLRDNPRLAQVGQCGEPLLHLKKSQLAFNLQDKQYLV